MFAAMVVRLIGVYQRWLSPRKGFSCAHRVLAGKASCSTFTRRAVNRHGVVRGFFLMQRRLQSCRHTYLTALASAQEEEDQRRKRPGSDGAAPRKPANDEPDKSKKKSDPCYSYCDLPLSGGCSPFGGKPSKGDGLDCGPDLDCSPC